MSYPILCEPVYPPLSSSYNLRVVNRRFISHLLFESIENKKFITLILTHGPNYWAYKSSSYRLMYECKSSQECIKEAKKIDNFLQSGYNIALVIEGDFIRKIVYLENQSLW
ncbi:MAG: hypothetical protein ACK4UJ_06150 [Leptonema sp. (in: bacteria)]